MDVVTFGESMVLLTPDSPGPMRYAGHFSRKFGGAESNVAIGLARLGHKAGWISRVGDDEFGRGMIAFIQGSGVDVSRVQMDAEAPTAIYFKEFRRANDVRVYYYRKHSAASRMTGADIDEHYVAQAKYLHITGITPALSDSCHETVFHAIRIAKKHGVRIVFDPNLRKKLWTEAKARETLIAIAAEADIVLPGIAEGTFMFGDTDAEVLCRRFLDNGAGLVVLKNGEHGAYYATAEQFGHVPGYPVAQVVDPVGAGDAFAAGLLSGMLDGLPLAEAVGRGNALGAFATMVNGDVEGLPERDELDAFVKDQYDDVHR